MKTHNLFTTIMLLVATIWMTMASTANATSSIDRMTVQAYIKKSSGVAIPDATYTMVFVVMQGSNPVWAQEYPIATTNGLFTKTLSGSGQDYTSDSTIPADMRVDGSGTFGAAKFSSQPSGEISVRIYVRTAIDGANPDFSVQVGAVPTAMIAAVAQSVENGTVGLSSLDSAATATAGGVSSAGKLPLLDSGTGLIPTSMLPAIDTTTGLSNGSITGSGSVTYQSAAGSTTTVGNSSGASTVAIQSGTGGISQTVNGTTGNISFAAGSDSGSVTVTPGTNTGAVTIGSATSSGAVTLQSGAGDIQLSPASGTVRVMKGGLNIVNAGNSGSITLLANTAASSWSMMLPGSAGTGNQFLMTNGLGTTSWADIPWTAPGAIGSVTPSTGAFTTLSASDQITSTLPDGTAPFVVASTTNVPNLNASSLNGKTFADPGAIGGTTPAAGTFTSLSAPTVTSASNLGVAAAAGSTTTVGDGTGASATVVQSGSGKIKVGSTGTGFTAMGVCTTASITVTNTLLANQTCTGIPASTNVVVHCTGSAAFTTPAARALYARANGTADKIDLTLTNTNSVAMTYTCLWIQP